MQAANLLTLPRPSRRSTVLRDQAFSPLSSRLGLLLQPTHNLISLSPALRSCFSVVSFVGLPSCTAALYTTGSTGFRTYTSDDTLPSGTESCCYCASPRLIHRARPRRPDRNTGGAPSLHCGVGVDFHRLLSHIEAAIPVSPCASPQSILHRFPSSAPNRSSSQLSRRASICGFQAVPYSNTPLLSYNFLPSHHGRPYNFRRVLAADSFHHRPGARHTRLSEWLW